MKKHTPGPWEYRNGNAYKDEKLLASAWMTERAVELNNDVEWDKGKESWLSYRNRTEEERNYEAEVREANAELIAAAPDLLEACDAVMKCQRGKHLPAEVVLQLGNAIAKAVPYNEIDMQGMAKDILGQT